MISYCFLIFFIPLEEWFETSFSLNSGSCSIILRGWLNSEWTYWLVSSGMWQVLKKSSLREKCVCSQLFYSAFSRISTEYGLFLLRIRTLFTQCIVKTVCFDKIIHTILKLNSAIISVLKSSYVCLSSFNSFQLCYTFVFEYQQTVPSISRFCFYHSTHRLVFFWQKCPS